MGATRAPQPSEQAVSAARDLDALPRLPDIDTSKLQKFTCEFCKKGFWVDVDAGHLIHEVPYCLEFEAYDPIHYMRENNRIKLGKAAKA
jgi:hypothetical protein